MEVVHNRHRRHSYLGFLSPVDYEEAFEIVTLAAYLICPLYRRKVSSRMRFESTPRGGQGRSRFALLC